MTTAAGHTEVFSDRLDALYTPVIADVLDRLGYRDQSFRAEIRPLFPGARAAGVARTVRTIPAPELRPPNLTRERWRPSTRLGLAT